MSDSKSIKKSARYIAVFDTGGVHPDGSISENAELILDAIPVSFLEHLSESQEQSEMNEINFLLLRVVDQSSFVELLEDTGGYVQILLSDFAPSDRASFRATTVSLGVETNDNLNLFVSLDSSGPERRLLKLFHKIAKFSDHPPLKDITLFDTPKPPVALAVYDVGQASFSAVVDEFEHPLFYFDFGWPISFNSKSIPKTKSDFYPPACDKARKMGISPPVVLSHLDWDHWGFAYESGMAKWDDVLDAWKTEVNYKKDAINRPWLMRRPNLDRHKLGPSHIHFVQKLSKMELDSGASVLNFWPENLRSFHFDSVLIFKCSPTKTASKKSGFLRNNEGLGMLLYATGARVLLVGDADYPSVPFYAKRNLTGIVAAHHGGKVTAGSIPKTAGYGRMIFSGYPGCYSNVPDKNVENEAYTKGWSIARTSDRIDCFRASAKKVQCGNRLIRLSKTPLCTCNAVPINCICVTKLQSGSTI